MTDGLLPEPIVYWEQRHASSDAWRSGGDRGLSAAENQEFYAWRLGKIVELLRATAGAERPLRILDAGCGRGHFTDGLRKCGHRVTGIDASATAIARATESFGGGFFRSELHSFAPPRLFQAVLCIDVLFHILDDTTWRLSLEAFARYAAAESVLVLTDTFGVRRFVLGNYIVHRPASEYDDLLAKHDFVPVVRSPYPFHSNKNSFAVYRRSP